MLLLNIVSAWVLRDLVVPTPNKAKNVSSKSYFIGLTAGIFYLRLLIWELKLIFN